MAQKVKYNGGCHCGAVTYEAFASYNLKALRCNCSICKASGFIHVIVDKNDFKLLTGAEDITVYSFNSHQAKHTFCKHCGVKSFYYPRSHPEGISLNLNTLNVEKAKNIHYNDFNGQNWEENIQSLYENEKI